jgi:flagellar protein FlaG
MNLVTNTSTNQPIPAPEIKTIEPKMVAPQASRPADREVISKIIANSEVKPSTVSEASRPSREVIAKAAEQIQSFVHSMGRNLNISVDQTTGYHVVRVVNPDTNELIRQLPSEELLRIAQQMDSLQNALVSQKA